MNCHMRWPIRCSYMVLRPITYAARSTQPGGGGCLAFSSLSQKYRHDLIQSPRPAPPPLMAMLVWQAFPTQIETMGLRNQGPLASPPRTHASVSSSFPTGDCS
ncbi:hypothetical protein LX32DRAFT_96195 [Colletotrichum zoysiae]|uniref:Uncharacterized protein n=1 Tax=Colletotrichum zoysiae TaxID=1216348 RepID=A0AAD9H8U6_9PEZI|nr:hypothetical protein LX32DRAFT_96195 [Colletotrichum zoysiae]